MSDKNQPVRHTPPEPADDYDRHLLASVEHPGWHVIVVEEDAEGPAFAYSTRRLHSHSRENATAETQGCPWFLVEGLLSADYVEAIKGRLLILIRCAS